MTLYLTIYLQNIQLQIIIPIHKKYISFFVTVQIFLIKLTESYPYRLKVRFPSPAPSKRPSKLMVYSVSILYRD